MWGVIRSYFTLGEAVAWRMMYFWGYIPSERRWRLSSSVGGTHSVWMNVPLGKGFIRTMSGTERLAVSESPSSDCDEKDSRDDSVGSRERVSAVVFETPGEYWLLDPTSSPESVASELLLEWFLSRYLPSIDIVGVEL